MRWSSGLDVGIQRPERFDHTWYISRVIHVLMYVFELYVYVCMYLLQAISRPPSIGAQSDFFRCTNRGEERWFGPSLVAFDSVVGCMGPLQNDFDSGCMHVFLLMYFSVFEFPVVFHHDDIICMRKQLVFWILKEYLPM